MEEAKDKKNLSDSINITYSEDGVTEKPRRLKCRWVFYKLCFLSL